MQLDIQGHRGARGLLPENTVPAFLRALELGVTTLEMDVVISRDEKVVVSHEPWLSAEICSHPDGRPVLPDEEHDLRILDMLAADVRAFDCGRRGHPRFPRQEALEVGKPLLREVIQIAETYRSEQGLDLFTYSIETKSRPEWEGVYHPDPRSFVRRLREVLLEEDVLQRSIIQSFDVRTLQVAREIEPEWRTSLLLEQGESEGLDADLERLGFDPSIYSPDFHLVDASLVQAAHARGIKVIPWTVNTEADMRRMKDAGVDGFITDYPDVAMELFRQSVGRRG